MFIYLTDVKEQQKILDNEFNTTTYPDSATISRLTEIFNKMYKDSQTVTARKVIVRFSNMRVKENLRLKYPGLKEGDIGAIHCKKWSGKMWLSLCDLYKVSHNFFFQIVVNRDL